MYINDVEEYVSFLTKHKISADAFLYMYLISIKDYPLMFKYLSYSYGKGLSYDELMSLTSRGYLVNLNYNPKAEFSADMFEVTSKFTDIMDKCISANPADEFWDAYPAYLWIEGKRFAARNMDKDEFTKIYMSKVGKTKAEHQTVMEALEFGKNNQRINIGLDKFIRTKMYNDLAKEMVNGPKNSTYGDREF